MVDAKTYPIGHALVVVRLPDAIHQALLGDLAHQLLAVSGADQMQHQVERRRAAGAGQPVAIDLEQISGDLDRGKLLDEAGQVLPMDRALVAVQQSRPREQVGGGAHRADGGAGAVGAAQPGEQLAVVIRSAPRPLHRMTIGLVRPGPTATSTSHWSVVTRQPLLARTGPPPCDTICQL